jgi:hypothetical protein
MGVGSTYCQLCALPTQYDRYVPASRDLFAIERGAGSEFDDRHAWLLDAVVVGDAKEVADGCVRGQVTEGFVGDCFVGSGWECSTHVYHHACWRAVGEPRRPDDVKVARGTHAWAVLESYHGQLCRFRELTLDGRAWMLEDPASSPRSLARIEGLARNAHPRKEGDPDSVALLIRRDTDWRGYAARDASGGRRAVVRTRRGYTSLDRSLYPRYVCVAKEFTPSPTIDPANEDLELELKQTAEAADQAIMVFAGFRPSDVRYAFYARDAEATAERMARVPSIGQRTTFVTRHDPTWSAHAELIEEYGGS